MTTTQVLQTLITASDLSAADAEQLFGDILEGRLTEAELAAVLTALRMKGESVEEIAAAATCLRHRAARVPCQTAGLLDTCGTGGDEMHTFNISTTVAIVTAALGVPVAKHGNRGVSSTSGSAEVLETLGVRIDLPAETVGRCIEEIGIGFCFAPLYHSALKHAAVVRKQLRFRTIFNLLGPLINPAGAAFQLLGTGRTANAEKLAHALLKLGTERAIVVCGADSLDEVCLWGPTEAFEVHGGRVKRHTWAPESFGLAPVELTGIQVASPADSAAMIRQVLSGTPGPAADIVVANTAAALLVSGRAESLVSAAAQARHALESRHAEEKLNQLVHWTNSAV